MVRSYSHQDCSTSLLLCVGGVTRFICGSRLRPILERYRTLFTQDSIAKQQVDTQEALVRQYEGAVKMDQSQIDNARLQLTYARIVAPIDAIQRLAPTELFNLLLGTLTQSASATGEDERVLTYVELWIT